MPASYCKLEFRNRFTIVYKSDIVIFMKNRSILKVSFVALFAAIICAGCFIRIPLGVIPIVMQNILCILCAVLLGGVLGCAPVALFLLAGLIGLPIYSGGTGGLAVWLGPTGGFLPGYFLGALAAGLISGKPDVSEKKLTVKVVVRVCLAVVTGVVILYVPGVIRFSYWATAAGKVPVEKTAFAYTMGACVIPYIPGDILKTVIAVPVALKLRPVLAQYLYESSDNN